MRLLFVAQENHKISKGTVRVWMSLCQLWPKDAHITILLNRTHWADGDVAADLKNHSNVRCLQLPFRVPSEWFGGQGSVRRQSVAARAWRAGLRRLLATVLAPLTIVWLAVWLKVERLDGILSHNGGWPGGELNRWVIYAGSIARIPARVLVIHNVPVRRAWMARPWAWLYERLMGWLATDLVTVSQSCKVSLEERTAFNRDLKVFYNGIQISDASAPYASAEPPWTLGRPAVGFVGELAPRKGVHVLVEAMQSVHKPCQLVLIGTGSTDYVQGLRTLAERSPWAVHFLGFRDDVSALYPLFDVAVLPSIEFESFGMVLVEAMMEEKPVICSDFGGMKEVVADGETGFVVEAGSATATASALNSLLSDVLLRRRMGKAGRKRVEEYFSAGAMTERYVALFEGVAS